MTSETVADRARRIIELGIGQGDLSVLDELVAENVVEHQRGNNPGRDGAKEVTRTLHRWMSEFSLTVDADELEDAREQGLGAHQLFLAGKIRIDGDAAKAMQLAMVLAQLR